MLTYADVITLLTTFFIMLITFSTFEKEKFDLAKGALQGALGVTSQHRGARLSLAHRRRLRAGRMARIGVDSPPAWQQFRYLEDLAHKRLEDDDVGRAITPKLMRDGLVLAMPFERVFRRAETELSKEGVRMLARVADVLNQTENFVHVRCVAPSDHSPAEDTTRSNAECAKRLLRYLLEDAKLAPGRFSISMRGSDLIGNRYQRSGLAEVKILGTGGEGSNRP